MESDDQTDTLQPDIIHSGMTHFPSKKQVLTLIFLAILEAEGIYICIPLNRSSNMSFLIAQVFFLVVIVYAWDNILRTTPGPMTQLFTEEFIKKAVEQGFKPQHEKDQEKICTKCQIQKVAKLYHCKQCNRCVYKNFFHSKWLNTCVAKQNFSSFIAFLIFLEIYLILLVIDNLVFFTEIRSHSEDPFAEFLMANFRNSLVTSFMVLVIILMLLVVGMIASSYILAFRTKASVQPLGCKSGCEGLQKISSNDKILYKIRQSIRQSNYFNNNIEESSQHSNKDLFRETENYSGMQVDLKSIKKSFRHQPFTQQKQSMCSIEDYHGPFFKTDFFASAKIFNKKQSSMEKKKRISRLNSVNDDISNMTRDKWKRYIKSTFEKDSYTKRNSELDSVLEKRTEQNETPAQLFKEHNNYQNEEIKRRQSIMKSNSIGKRKIVSKFSGKDDIDKENVNNSLHPKKIRFVKRNSSNLAEIFEKESKLEDA